MGLGRVVPTRCQRRPEWPQETPGPGDQASAAAQAQLFYATNGEGVVIIRFCSALSGVYITGNAPAAANSVFYQSNDAIVYHLLGTTGWGATLAGRPTAIWSP